MNTPTKVYSSKKSKITLNLAIVVITGLSCTFLIRSINIEKIKKTRAIISSCGGIRSDHIALIIQTLLLAKN